MLGLFRVIKFALQDIGRNISLSFMTVLILVLMLLSMNTLLTLQVLTGEAVRDIKDQIDVSIFFDHEVTDAQVEEIRAYVDSFPGVVGVEYLDRETVLEMFRTVHSDDVDILASLEEVGENPLGPTMIIKTREPRDYEEIITALSIPEYEFIIESKTFTDTQTQIERIDTITGNVEKAVFALSAFFAVIAFFVIFNTIRVAIYTQRREIGIKKLVGATNWFVRGPYVIEAVLFSVLSVLISGSIVWVAAQFLDPYISVIFQREPFLTNYFLDNILVLTSVQFVGVLLLTVITSGLAMRRYLRT
jgi:cell division transport system permease protein